MGRGGEIARMTQERPNSLMEAGQPARSGLASDASRHAQFLNLYTEHRGGLFGHILALVGERELAQDVLQDASLLLWREFDKFTPGTSFGAWARAVALNCVRAARRTRAVAVLNDELMQQIADDRSRMEDRLDQRWRQLQDCIGKLRDDDAALVNEYYVADATADVVANRRGLTVHAIRKSIKRIRRLLFDCVERTRAE